MTQDQFAKCIELEAQGYIGVNLPWGVDTPVPGIVLFADPSHRHLFMVTPDGRAVDLIALYDKASDLVLNWGDGRSPSIPLFVGDFGRLLKLAKVLIPDAPLPESVDPEGVLREDGT